MATLADVSVEDRPKWCEHCEEPFTSRRARGGWTRTCSKSCAQLARMAKGEHPWGTARPSRSCGDCGEPLQRGSKADYCDGCRASRYAARNRASGVARRKSWPSCKIYFPTCPGCGAMFAARHPNHRYCSEECAERRMCRRCGQRAVSSTTYCSDCRLERKRAARRRHKAKRRAQKKLSPDVRSFDPVDIFERDGWRCGICRKRVNRKLRHPHPMSASLDHIVPLADGGEHTPLNTQCSHLRCNREKWHTGWGQLLLIG